MVTRKPVPTSAPLLSTAQTVTTNGCHAPLPYPTTPASLDTTGRANTGSSDIYSSDKEESRGFNPIGMDVAQQRRRRDSDVSSHGTWDSDDSRVTLSEHIGDGVGLPQLLQVCSSQRSIIEDNRGPAHVNVSKDELPTALRPGPLAPSPKTLDTPDHEEEVISSPWQLESRNPYLHKSNHLDNSQAVWAETASSHPTQLVPALPLPPSRAPPTLPSGSATPRNASAKPLIAEKSAAPASSYTSTEVLPVPQESSSRPRPTSPSEASQQIQTAEFPPTNPWRTASSPRSTKALPGSSRGPQLGTPLLPDVIDPHSISSLPLDSTCQQPRLVNLPVSTASPLHQTRHSPPLDWRPRSKGAVLENHAEVRSHSQGSVSASIPMNRPAMRSSESPPGHLLIRDQRQWSEHYQIKHITWLDRSTLRQSPILTQNANGPCPLLAMVNALVLTTPQHVVTVLVETLQRREQISLGLLLDAVFDELMSSRRGDTAARLPDVSELYSFLLALHTGMNVNPQFIVSGTAGLEPSGQLDLSIHQHNELGKFDETREMRLYSTFSIPLIHGWIPERNSPTYAAFQRRAHTFEGAQNMQFVEMDLQEKLRTSSLNNEERAMLQDIKTIKEFLANWPTQLTDTGLQSMSRNLAPGQIAILFRNDHFSTLYKEPSRGALMTLVTDAGYSSHAEIVWESLVDVNGAASEMFSGDFRVTSHNEDPSLCSAKANGHGERSQTALAKGHRNLDDQTASGAAVALPGSGASSTQPSGYFEDEIEREAHEQEDHDLALALQLQEEEDDRHRQAEERRRREQQLSEQFLSNEEPPRIPPRRSNNTTHDNRYSNPAPANPRTMRHPVPSRASRLGDGNTRPAVNRPTDRVDDPEAPPSYEQAASDRPYRPAGATAPASQGNPLSAYDALRRQQSAYSAQQSSVSINTTSTSASHNRRQSAGTRSSRISNSQPGTPVSPEPDNYYARQQARPVHGVSCAPNVREAEDKCRMM